MTVFPLRTLIDESLEMLRGRMEARGIRASVQLPDPEVRVRADREKILQVLVNVVGNAVKYNREGGAVEVAVGPAEPGYPRGPRARHGGWASLPASWSACSSGSSGPSRGSRGGDGPRAVDRARAPRAARLHDPRGQRAGARVDLHLHAAAPLSRRARTVAGRTSPARPRPSALSVPHEW